MSERRQAIANKLAKSNLFLAEVGVLMNHRFYLTAVNRLYYACFHAAKALLLTKDLVPKTHSGAINQLHLHFVQPREFDVDQAAFFSRLMQERIADDYSDALVLDYDEVQALLEPSRQYVSYVEELINRFIASNN